MISRIIFHCFIIHEHKLINYYFTDDYIYLKVLQIRLSHISLNLYYLKNIKLIRYVIEADLRWGTGIKKYLYLNVSIYLV